MKKRILGQYFTQNGVWLKPQIKDFIKSTNCQIAYDPFAGDGHLLEVAKKIGFNKTTGLDIDHNLGWKVNDSLVKIPTIDNAIIITNPPYLAKYSAKRKNIIMETQKYFDFSEYEDIYCIALEKMLAAQEYVVAIIPETFINSKFPKNRLSQITIVENNPFNDTDAPICIACFDGKSKSLNQIKVFKNEEFIGSLGELEDKRLIPKKNQKISFNKINGNLALRGVDLTDESKRIAFMRKENLKYNLKGIKHSSRLITIIEVNISENKLNSFILKCNQILEEYRNLTKDVLLSPFKGNMKNGVRRRRLDYQTARAIIEKAIETI